MTISLAHISDPHLTSLATATIGELCNQRILGYLSWRQRRRYMHKREVLDAMLSDLAQTRPDNLLVTGDLTQIGLPAEHSDAASWLTALGKPERVLAIPGNHDTYVAQDWEHGLAQWSPYLRGDAKGTGNPFPSLRIRDHVALIGLSSAVTTAPFMATGSLGEEQLSDLAELLKNTGQQDLFRIVLIHHPPVPGSEKWRKRLVDAHRFCAVIAEHGAELICHGHSHRWQRGQLPSRFGPVEVIGTPSASAISRHADYTGSYALYQPEQMDDGWRLGIRRRRYCHQRDEFVAADSDELLIPRQNP